MPGGDLAGVLLQIETRHRGIYFHGVVDGCVEIKLSGKISNQKFCTKWKQILFLPCVHSGLSAFVLPMERSRWRCWIQTGGRDIHSVVDGRMENN